MGRINSLLGISLVSVLLGAALAIAANVAWKDNRPAGSKWNDNANWAGGAKPADGDNVSFLVPTNGADGAILDVDAPAAGALSGFRMANRDAKLTIRGKKLAVNTNDSEVSAGTIILDGTTARATWAGNKKLKILRNADQPQITGQLLPMGEALIDCDFENEGVVTIKGTADRSTRLTAKSAFTNLAKRTPMSAEPTITLHSFGASQGILVVVSEAAPGILTNRGTIVTLGETSASVSSAQNLHCALVNDGRLSVRKTNYAINVNGSATTTHVNIGTLALESDAPQDGDTRIEFFGLPAEPFKNNGRIEGCGVVRVSPGKLRTRGTFDPKKIRISEGLDFAGSDPLDAAGGLTVEGDYEEESAATLAIDIATPDSAGWTYDQILVTGAASLAGRLDVNLIGGYPLPAPTDSFEVFRADGGRTGLFSNASSIVDAGAGTFGVVYTATSVWLTNFQTSTAVEPMSWGEVKARFR